MDNDETREQVAQGGAVPSVPELQRMLWLNYPEAVRVHRYLAERAAPSCAVTPARELCGAISRSGLSCSKVAGHAPLTPFNDPGMHGVFITDGSGADLAWPAVSWRARAEAPADGEAAIRYARDLIATADFLDAHKAARAVAGLDAVLQARVAPADGEAALTYVLSYADEAAGRNGPFPAGYARARQVVLAALQARAAAPGMDGAETFEGYLVRKYGPNGTAFALCGIDAFWMLPTWQRRELWDKLATSCSCGAKIVSEGHFENGAHRLQASRSTTERSDVQERADAREPSALAKET